MTTPDTEGKICGAIVTSNTGMKDGHACFNKRPCPIHTPDTEWEKEVRNMVMTKFAIFDAFKHPTIDGEAEMESLIDLISNRFVSLLTSRDTYWKERVREEVEGMKVWFEEEDYCKTFPLISKEDLLDNLK